MRYATGAGKSPIRQISYSGVVPKLTFDIDKVDIFDPL